jgi:hypothetical protein
MIDVFIGDDASPDPVVVPTPAPQPAPVTPARPVAPPATPSLHWWQRPGFKTTIQVLNIVAVLALVGVVGWQHFGPKPASVADTYYSTGKTFVPILGSTYGDGWIAAADAMEQGKTVADCQQIIAGTWKDKRVAAFIQNVTPVFQAVMPEGQEPGDPAKRKAIAEMWRSFGKGLKGQ